MSVRMSNEEIKAFWNDRARFGENAGSDDYNVKYLELREIVARVPRESFVLDVGAGNGQSLIQLAKRNACTGVGVDYAEKLVELARAAIESEGLSDRIDFRLGRIPGLPQDLRQFDVVISERCLINVTDPRMQVEAFAEIRNKVAPGGVFLMFENSQQALERTDQLRASIGVGPMKSWHAFYLDEEAVTGWETDDFVLEELSHFTSTYHFLSRIVYAKLAQDAGEEPRYDSPINQLSLQLPQFGDFGPTKLWVWRKRR